MRNVVMILLALVALLLFVVMVGLSPYFGRGAGAVEVGLAGLLAMVAFSQALAGLRSESSSDRALAAVVLVLPPLMVVGIIARVQANNHSDAVLAACSENLKTLAAAVDGYAASHGGAAPATLPEAVGGALPTCRAAGRETYASGYQRSEDGSAYTICCASSAHREHVYDSWRVEGPGWPQYSSALGRVITRPEPPRSN